MTILYTGTYSLFQVTLMNLRLFSDVYQLYYLRYAMHYGT
jgi:hypothetical protein